MEEFEHIDPIGHPMKIGDLVLFTEVKRSSVFLGEIVSFSKTKVNIEYGNIKYRSKVMKDTKGVYVVNEQYKHNQDKFPENFI